MCIPIWRPESRNTEGGGYINLVVYDVTDDTFSLQNLNGSTASLHQGRSGKDVRENLFVITHDQRSPVFDGWRPHIAGRTQHCMNSIVGYATSHIEFIHLFALAGKHTIGVRQ